MKTKELLLILVLFTFSIQSISAQKLLISENFSTEEWETEFIRLNPTYVTPAANTSTSVSPFYSGVFMGKYELYSGTIECGDGALPCVDGSMVHNNGGSAVAWRLKKQTSGASYLTLPTITSAGRVSVHVKSGGVATSIKVQRVDTVEGAPVITDLTTLSLAASSNTKFLTQVDEVKTFWVDSRTPVTLRLGQVTGGLFIKIFGFSVEEHASVSLKNSIDSATTIQAANVDNIGTTFGKYPQEAYDALGTAITNANVIFDNVASTRTQLIDGTTSINTAISDFEASKIDVGTGINTPKIITIKQNGRQLTLNETANIAIYNTVGTLVFQQDQVKVTEVPASIGNGIFLVKSGLSTRKIYLNN